MGMTWGRLLLQSYLLLRLTVRVRFVDGYDIGLGYYYKATNFLGSL